MIQKLITLTLLVIAAICLITINFTHEGPVFIAGLILAIFAFCTAGILLVYRNKNQGSPFDIDPF